MFRDSGERTRPLQRGRRLSSRLRDDTPLAQFARFVFVGVGSNIVYIPLFLLLRSDGAVLANLVGATASTIVASELHRRLTFNAVDRVTWFVAQWEAGGLAVVGLTLSSLALAGAERWLPALDGIWQLGLVFAVNGAVGILRFLALRGLVFRFRGGLKNA